MKLRKSDVNLIIMVLGIAIGILAWRLVYTSYKEKTEVLSKENAQLQTEVDYLQDLADHKQQYLDETAAMSAEIEEIQAQFPAEYREEDDILYARALETDYDAFVSSLGIGATAAIEVTPPAPVVPAAAEEESEDAEAEAAAPVAAETAPASDVLLYRTPLALDMTTSYASVKDIIEKVNTDRDRKSVEQLSMAFDSETGDLSVKLNYNAYSLTGTDKTYESPTISGIRYGSSNIFNTAERKRAIDAQKAAAEAAAGVQ